MTLPAFVRRTLLLQQSIDTSCTPGPQQQTCNSGFAAGFCCWCMMGQTDGRTPYRYAGSAGDAVQEYRRSTPPAGFAVSKLCGLRWIKNCDSSVLSVGMARISSHSKVSATPRRSCRLHTTRFSMIYTILPSFSPGGTAGRQL